jgi:MoaA/NifB/PqqE/SkfB family radical SAM enzyme
MESEVKDIAVETGSADPGSGRREAGRRPGAALRYALAWLRSPARGGGRQRVLPTQLNLPITDNCNARCVMCDVWKEPSEGELDAGELGRLLSDPLFARVEHLGISGGEPTLRRDLVEVARAAHDALPALRSISFTTHGFHVSRWEKLLPALAALARERGTQLRVHVSVDGVGALHDRVRGIPGAWEKALATSERVRAHGVALEWEF